MTALGAFLRRYHETVQDFDPGPEPTWRIGRRALRAGELVRHGDLGPYNIIFVDGLPAGLIDWDLAEPGTRLQDLAQMAWLSIPLRPRETWRAAGFRTAPRFTARLASLCEGYGWEDRSAVVEAVHELQAVERERLLTWGREGIHPWSHFLAIGDLDEIEREMTWLAEHRRMLI
jgi:hypothetical protein